MEAAKTNISFEDLEAEQQQIEQCYLNMRFTQRLKKETIACYKKCGGNPRYPFRIEPDQIVGKEEVCLATA